MSVNIGDKIKNIRDGRIGIVVRIFESGSIGVLERISPVVICTHDNSNTLEIIEKKCVDIFDERLNKSENKKYIGGISMDKDIDLLIEKLKLVVNSFKEASEKCLELEKVKDELLEKYGQDRVIELIDKNKNKDLIDIDRELGKYGKILKGYMR